MTICAYCEFDYVNKLEYCAFSLACDACFNEDSSETSDEEKLFPDCE